MPTRDVVLTEHHEKVIEKLIRSGRYQNASEVLREGLRLVERAYETVVLLMYSPAVSAQPARTRAR